MSDLDELERLAREATPGPWKCEVFPAVDGSTYTDVTHCIVEPPTDDPADWHSVTDACRPQDDRYIAAASPDVILDLIARVRAAEAERLAVYERSGVMYKAYLAVLENAEGK